MDEGMSTAEGSFVINISSGSYRANGYLLWWIAYDFIIL